MTKMKLKPGYRLRDGDQVPTRLTTIEAIMSNPRFAQGVADVRAGRSYPIDYDLWGHTNDAWCYERGRQWAALAPRNAPLKVNGKITQRAMDLYDEGIR
jgi:hypothetical protein